MICFIDLDNTLADFKSSFDIDKDYKKEGYFKNLKPLWLNVLFIQKLRETTKVVVLSKCPHDRARQEKLQWLEQYLPGIESLIILESQDKFTEAFKKYGDIVYDSVLFDDYSKEIQAWKGVAVKVEYDSTQPTLKTAYESVLLNKKEVKKWKN